MLLSPTIIIIVVLIALAFIIVLIHCGCFDGLKAKDMSVVRKDIFDHVCDLMTKATEKPAMISGDSSEATNASAKVVTNSRVFRANLYENIKFKKSYDAEVKATRFGVITKRYFFRLNNSISN